MSLRINRIIYKMDFVSLVHRFSYLYTLFGIYSFNTTTDKKIRTWKISIRDILPPILHLLATITFLAICIFSRHQSSKLDSILHTVVTYTHIASEVVLQLAFVCQALVFRGELRNLCRKYDAIQKYVKTRLDHRIDFGFLRKRMYQLIAIVCVPQMASLISRRVGTKANIFSLFNNMLATFHLLSSLEQIYMIAHIELLYYFLMLPGKWVRQHTVDFSATCLCQWKNGSLKSSGSMEILHLKWMHYKLWETTMHVNRIFGWSMNMIILRNAIQIAYGSYWVYMYVILDIPAMVLWRKYLASSWHRPLLKSHFIFCCIVTRQALCSYVWVQLCHR